MKPQKADFASGQKSIAFLGASRGLGDAVLDCYLAKTQLDDRLLRVSRKRKMTPAGADLKSVLEMRVDFAKTETWQTFLDEMRSQHVHRLFYFAGGGPYGNFAEGKWEAQLWSLYVTFLFPAFLIQHGVGVFQQMVFVGSAIAESKADPGAAMYCASKHGLKGLIETVQSEMATNFSATDLRLVSPGYMDTDLLPKNAWPRTKPPQGQRIFQPQEIAQIFCDFVEDRNQAQQNLVLPSFKS